MTDDLAAMAAFIEARLAEDEAAAKAVFDAARLFSRPSALGHSVFDGSGIVVTHDRTAVIPSDAATHIALHDPAQVLRDVGSARMLLAEIQAMPHDYVDGDIWCPAGYEPPSGPCRCGSDDRKRRMLAAIAMRWNSHADYLPGWTPAAVGG